MLNEDAARFELDNQGKLQIVYPWLYAHFFSL